MLCPTVIVILITMEKHSWRDIWFNFIDSLLGHIETTKRSHWTTYWLYWYSLSTVQWASHGDTRKELLSCTFDNGEFSTYLSEEPLLIQSVHSRVDPLPYNTTLKNPSCDLTPYNWFWSYQSRIESFGTFQF